MHVCTYRDSGTDKHCGGGKDSHPHQSESHFEAPLTATHGCLDIDL
jgi:hypothetical protein